ncbi:MAG: hypothetical protein JNJ93_01055 [Acinetobacter sp.]|nr:hypothetical protein [Acinetobacter sp.]
MNALTAMLSEKQLLRLRAIFYLTESAILGILALTDSAVVSVFKVSAYPYLDKLFFLH